MPTLALTTPPLHRTHLDRTRALHIAAFDALIKSLLDEESKSNLTYAARQLAEALHSTGIGNITFNGDSLSITICGIRATTYDESSLTLLRKWQFAARDAIAGGVQS
jgi:hypothetical protein